MTGRVSHEEVRSRARIQVSPALSALGGSQAALVIRQRAGAATSDATLRCSDNTYSSWGTYSTHGTQGHGSPDASSATTVRCDCSGTESRRNRVQGTLCATSVAHTLPGAGVGQVAATPAVYFLGTLPNPESVMAKWNGACPATGGRRSIIVRGDAPLAPQPGRGYRAASPKFAKISSPRTARDGDARIGFGHSTRGADGAEAAPPSAR